MLTPGWMAAVQVGQLGMGRPQGMDQVGTREVEQVATVVNLSFQRLSLTAGP